MNHWQIGDVRITKFVKKEFTGNVHRFLLLDATPECCKEIDWLKPHFMTENAELRLSVQAFVIETPSCRVTVDTCFGNDKRRENERSNMLSGPFLRDLEAAGFSANSFDYVLCKTKSASDLSNGAHGTRSPSRLDSAQFASIVMKL